MRFASSSLTTFGLWAAFACAPLALSACWGAESTGPSTEVEAAAAAPAERLDATWPVQFATDESVAAYDKAGWTSFVMRRDYRAAVNGFASSGGLPLARIHSEAGAMYRQAALLAAQSLIQTYGETPEPTDPLGTKHLLTVSYAILGDLDKAKAVEGLARLG